MAYLLDEVILCVVILALVVIVSFSVRFIFGLISLGYRIVKLWFKNELS